MTAPTEAEIRAAIDQRLNERISGTAGDGLRNELLNLCREAGDPMGWPATFVIDRLIDDPGQGGVGPTAEEGSLWGLIGRGDAILLDKIVSDAARRAARRCEAIILEELTAAGLRFAAEHPDAPRAYEPIPA